jgi:hypothetical protein
VFGKSSSLSSIRHTNITIHNVHQLFTLCSPINFPSISFPSLVLYNGFHRPLSFPQSSSEYTYWGHAYQLPEELFTYWYPCAVPTFKLDANEGKYSDKFQLLRSELAWWIADQGVITSEGLLLYGDGGAGMKIPEESGAKSVAAEVFNNSK